MTPTDRPTREPRAASPRTEGGGDRRRPIAGILLGVGILLGGTAGFLFAERIRPRETRPAPVTTPQPRDERISTERQIAARRLAALPDAPFDLLSLPNATGTVFVPPLRLDPPYETIDSAIFDTLDRRIRLARLRPLARNEVCFDAAHFRFACGLMGRAALQNLLADQSVVCRPLFRNGIPAASEIVEADCRTSAGDLAEALVRRGFATPSPLAGASLDEALAAARAARAGIWSGPWVGPEADPAAADVQEVPFGSIPPRIASPAEEPAIHAGAAETPAAAPEVTAPPRRDTSAAPRPSKPAAPRRSPPPNAAAADTYRPPSLEALAPNAPRDRTEPPGVVAGPIQPPPPGLAERLGAASGSN